MSKEATIKNDEDVKRGGYRKITQEPPIIRNLIAIKLLRIFACRKKKENQF